MKAMPYALEVQAADKIVRFSGRHYPYSCWADYKEAKSRLCLLRRRTLAIRPAGTWVFRSGWEDCWELTVPWISPYALSSFPAATY